MVLQETKGGNMPKIKLTKSQKREFAAVKAIMAERRAKRKAKRESAEPCKVCGAAEAGPICTVCARG
jgi:hypothetical protein